MWSGLRISEAIEVLDQSPGLEVNDKMDLEMDGNSTDQMAIEDKSTTGDVDLGAMDYAPSRRRTPIHN